MTIGSPPPATVARPLEERLFALPVGEWVEGGLLEWAKELIFPAGTEALFGDGAYTSSLEHAFTVSEHQRVRSLSCPYVIRLIFIELKVEQFIFKSAIKGNGILIIKTLNRAVGTIKST